MKFEDLALPADKYELSRIIGNDHSALSAFVRERDSGCHAFVKAKGTPEGREHLEREATVLRSLGHPQVPRLKHADLDAKIPCIVTEFMGRPDDHAALRDRENPPREAAILCLSALQPLAHAHANGVTHRDIKTANLVMRHRAGWVALVDYELSLREGEEDFQTGESVSYTAEYAAPERAMGQRGDASADIYSMGVVMYELLYGRLPFTGETPSAVFVQQCYGEIDFTCGDEAPVPPELVAIIERATQTEPGDRYESAETMGGDLAAYLESGR